MSGYPTIRLSEPYPTIFGASESDFMYTSGLQWLAGVHDPPESCDIPKEAEANEDYHGGSGGTGNG